MTTSSRGDGFSGRMMGSIEPFLGKIAQFIAQNPGARRGQIDDFLRAEGEQKSPVSIWRYLSQAVDAGLITMQGATSTARYYPSEELRIQVIRREVAQPSMKRTRVAYDQDFLESYAPNHSFYLSASRRDQMNRRCPVGTVPIQEVRGRDLTLLLAGLPWASSKLEGNAYDLASTQDLIFKGVEKLGVPERDKVMIMNHHEAIKHLTENITYPPLEDSMGLSMAEVRALHSILSHGLLRDPAEEGALRARPVSVKDTAYIPPENVMLIRSEFVKLINKAQQITDPFEQAFFLNVHIPYLQPFVDCNKRTARLVANISLMRSGVMPMTWMDLNEADYISGIIGIYELKSPDLLAEVFTDSYMRSLERFEIMRSERDPDPMLIRYRSEIRSYIRNIILHDDETIPSTVDAADASRFWEYTERELAGLKDSDGIRVHQYSLRLVDYNRWIDRIEEREFRRQGLLTPDPGDTTEQVGLFSDEASPDAPRG